jgi:PAS domain S-box-containing protein
LFDNLAQAIVGADETQRILLFNKAVGNMFGYRAGEVVGQPLDLLLPERIHSTHRQNGRGNIVAAGGSHFDPRVVEAFSSLLAGE